MRLNGASQKGLASFQPRSASDFIANTLAIETPTAINNHFHNHNGTFTRLIQLERPGLNHTMSMEAAFLPATSAASEMNTMNDMDIDMDLDLTLDPEIDFMEGDAILVSYSAPRD